MIMPQKSKTDVCGKCGRTRERIEWEFEQMRKMGVVVIGNEVLLYCDNCKKWFCGSCQVDLGLKSGCPFCGKALD
jgi:hypothetical protein